MIHLFEQDFNLHLFLRGRARLRSRLSSLSLTTQQFAKLPAGQFEATRGWPSYCLRRDIPERFEVGQGNATRENLYAGQIGPM